MFTRRRHFLAFLTFLSLPAFAQPAFPDPLPPWLTVTRHDGPFACAAAPVIRAPLWLDRRPTYICPSPTPARATYFTGGAPSISLDLRCPPPRMPACRAAARRIARAANWQEPLPPLPETDLIPLPLDPAGNRFYTTDAHALLADLPAAWTVCVESATNHGLTVALDAVRCDAPSLGDRVTFWVAYNVVREYPATPAMRREQCGDAPATWSALRLAGTPLMQCARGDGHRWFGLRRRPGLPVGNWTELGIEAACAPSRMPACRARAAGLAARFRGWTP